MVDPEMGVGLKIQLLQLLLLSAFMAKYAL